MIWGGHMTVRHICIEATSRIWGANSHPQTGVSPDVQVKRADESCEAMTSHSSGGTAPVGDFADLQRRVTDYTSRIGELRTPNDVLDSLHVITTKSLPLGVLTAVRLGGRAKCSASAL